MPNVSILENGLTIVSNFEETNGVTLGPCNVFGEGMVIQQSTSLACIIVLCDDHVFISWWISSASAAHYAQYINGFVQDCSNSITNVLELQQSCTKSWYTEMSGLILGLHPANDKHCYKVTPSLIGWAQTWNQPWKCYPKHHTFYTNLTLVFSAPLACCHTHAQQVSGLPGYLIMANIWKLEPILWNAEIKKQQFS